MEAKQMTSIQDDSNSISKSDEAIQRVTVGESKPHNAPVSSVFNL